MTRQVLSNMAAGDQVKPQNPAFGRQAATSVLASQKQ